MPKYRLLLVIFPVWTGKASGHFPPWHSGGRTEDLHALFSAAGACGRIMEWLSYGSYVPMSEVLCIFSQGWKRSKQMNLLESSLVSIPRRAPQHTLEFSPSLTPSSFLPGTVEDHPGGFFHL